jgi:hypothetical protein
MIKNDGSLNVRGGNQPAFHADFGTIFLQYQKIMTTLKETKRKLERFIFNNPGLSSQRWDYCGWHLSNSLPVEI